MGEPCRVPTLPCTCMRIALRVLYRMKFCLATGLTELALRCGRAEAGCASIAGLQRRPVAESPHCRRWPAADASADRSRTQAQVRAGRSGRRGTPGCRELFSPEQIPGGGSGGGRGPISGLFSSWAAALRFVRSHSPAMTTAFSNPHAPFERDPCGSPVS